MRWPSLTVIALVFGIGAPAGADERPAIEKTVRTAIYSVRDGRIDLAAKQFAFPVMAELLLGPHWREASPAEQSELAAGLERLVRANRFAKARERLARVDAILFTPTTLAAESAACRAILVSHQAEKKTELVIDWQLTRTTAGWQIVDAMLLGDSVVAGLREDHVEPLWAKGGVAAVLAALRAELKKLAERQTP